MRVFIIIDETVFFHPSFLNDFLSKTSDEVVGACLVTKVLPKNNIETYMVRNFYHLRPREIFGLGFRKILLTARSVFDRSKYYTVRAVLEGKGIPYRELHFRITDDDIDYIRSFEPDVIVSSQSLYLNKKVLSIPKKCCINRHSGLLPRNGGLWPGFQAMRKGEKETGVSIHMMTEKIDGGIVLSQIAVPIRDGETVWELYDECFRISSDALVAALDKVRAGDMSPVENGLEPDYYSFPTNEQWKEFRARGGKYL